jgi:hypothetical protein
VDSLKRGFGYSRLDRVLPDAKRYLEFGQSRQKLRRISRFDHTLNILSKRYKLFSLFVKTTISKYRDTADPATILQFLFIFQPFDSGEREERNARRICV